MLHCTHHLLMEPNSKSFPFQGTTAMAHAFTLILRQTSDPSYRIANGCGRGASKWLPRVRTGGNFNFRQLDCPGIRRPQVEPHEKSGRRYSLSPLPYFTPDLRGRLRRERE